MGSLCMKFYDDRCKEKAIMRKNIFKNQCIVTLTFEPQNQ